MSAAPAPRLPGARLPAWSPVGVYLHDLACAALATALAIVARYHFEAKPLPTTMLTHAVVAAAAVAAAIFPLFRLHRGLWSFTALNDGFAAARAVLAVDVLLLPVLFLIDRLQDFPRSTVLILPPLLFAALMAGRLARAAAVHHGFGSAFRLEDRSAGAIVVVGVAASASAYLTGARRSRRPAPRLAGIVALDDLPPGRFLHGAEVLGDLDALANVLVALHAAEGVRPQVVLAEPRPPRALIEAVLAAAAKAGAHVSRVRGAMDDGALQPIAAADLLGRPPRVLDVERARGLVSGRRVLVTGAGGTIGSELTRQALALGPERLTLFDASEFNLYAIDRALAEAKAPPLWTAALGDVRDAARLKALFARAEPQVVLHAAALKHVPLMESNPCEAVLTNLLGAMQVAVEARARADAFVFISTDKAVNPTNVMGATKRAAERAVAALMRGGRARCAIVRFGNVLGSSGSVAPLFEAQIAAGGPVTVTDPEMMRYFMTVQEAASLVLQAAALPAGEGGAQTFVLDMGEPVRIADLARQLIALHGLRPEIDIPIVFTGLRPGEKLYEEIFYDLRSVHATGADGVMAAAEAEEDWATLRPAVEALIDAARARDEPLTLARLQALEPAFRPA